MLLRSEGYRVVIAASAGEACAVVRNLQEKPQLIVSDYHLLDDSTGVDAIVAVRRQLDACTPAILVTGDTSKIVQETQKLDNCTTMSKPVSTDQLLQLVRIAVLSGTVPA
jgi:CheY-like chemotaxis protein